MSAQQASHTAYCESCGRWVPAPQLDDDVAICAVCDDDMAEAGA